MQKLPIGVQDFVQLRQDNLLYVDKTAKLAELIENGRRYFLSRPPQVWKVVNALNIRHNVQRTQRILQRSCG